VRIPSTAIGIVNLDFSLDELSPTGPSGEAFERVLSELGERLVLEMVCEV